MHPCRYPACSQLLKRSGYCDIHKANAQKIKLHLNNLSRNKDPELSEAMRIRSSYKWKRVRLLKLSNDPLCEDPHGCHANKQTTETARQVHHIKGLRSHPDLAFVWSNLMSVCTKCHARLERDEIKKENQTLTIDDNKKELSVDYKYF